MAIQYSYKYPKKNNKKKKEIDLYSKEVKLLTGLIFIIFLIALIVTASLKSYPSYNITSNISNEDIAEKYNVGNIYNINLSDQTEDYLINNEGTYNFTGSTNYKIIVNAEKEKIYMCFNSVTMDSTESCIIVEEAKHVFLNFTGDNNFTSTGTTTIDDLEYDACIYSKDDVTINGLGNLIINSSSNGIKASDDLEICNLNLDITSSSHAVNVNDGLDIYNATVNITSSGDGIHSGNETTTKTFVTIDSSNLTIYSKCDAISSTGLIGIKSGTLDLDTPLGYTSTTNSQKGLKSDKAVKIEGGEISISSREAGIKTNIFEITGGVLDIYTQADAIHVTDYIVIKGGTTTINASDDALHSDSDISIEGGTTTISSCCEGIEGVNIYISGGLTKVTSTDDGVNVSCNPNDNIGGGMGGTDSSKPNSGVLKITGGVLYVNAAGDGLDSNDKIVMTGGLVLVDGPTNSANGSLDYDTTCKITGGTLIACGATGMAQSATGGECGGLYTLSGSANQTFVITDNDGNLVLAYTPSKAYQCVALSSNLLKKNQTYKIYIGATVEGTDTCGFITSGTITKTGTLKQTFTATVPTSSSSSGGMGGGMGGGSSFGGGGRK